MLTVINSLFSTERMQNSFSGFNQKVPIWSLITFRLAFGFMMFLSIVRFWQKNWIEDFYIKPTFHFTYFGFEFVKPLGAQGMYFLFFVCALAALGIFLGAFYRFSAALFFLTFTYIELIDKTTYLNHYYFVSLLAFLMIFLPAARNFSIDTYFNPQKILTHVPLWTIAALRIQMGLLYFFAGVAKINYDWLILAQPLKIWLPPHGAMLFCGFLKEEITAYLFSWAGAAYDLFIPFLLIFARTRFFAYILVVVFHALTSFLFPIGMFPYIMIVAALVFFSGREHEIIYTKIFKNRASLKHFFVEKTSFEANKKLFYPPKIFVFCAAIYFFLQIFLPVRCFLYPSQLFWAEEGFRFSWRVMLIEKMGNTRFFVFNPKDKKRHEIDDEGYLTTFQRKMMSTQPDMILQYAHFLKEKMQEKGINNPQIYVEAYATLNGRESALLIDPNTDLSQEKESFAPKKWILRRKL